jgi:short subunit fatty acids transporter
MEIIVILLVIIGFDILAIRDEMAKTDAQRMADALAKEERQLKREMRKLRREAWVRKHKLHYLLIGGLALMVVQAFKHDIEKDALTCNRLTSVPLLASHLTCQKLYHYQPDPFTG